MRYNILSLLLLLPLIASAQTERRTTYMIGVGPTKIYDTYLSQEHFSGTGLTFLATSQRSNANLHWSTLMEHQAHLASADDRSGDSNEMQGDYSFLIGRLRRFDILPSLSVEVGGMAVANAGFIYNTSNGNNPAQARLSLNVMPTATATWRFRLFHRQMALRYETQLPLVGVMFSPNYGQSYYEIFNRGDYDHNVVFTSLAVPQLRHHLSVDVPLTERCALRVGYLGDYRQAKPNNLRQHHYYNAATIGIVIKKK